MRFFYLLLFSLSLCFSAFAASVKEPNVAGAFYSADAKELSVQIDTFLQKASVNASKNIQAMIAPHAGYMYSGAVAAYSYKAVAQNKYATIVILGPSHFFPFEGISVWPEGGFQTPLGTVKVDTDFSKKIMETGQFKFLP